MKKAAQVIFFLLVCSSLLTPIWVFKDLLFPFVTSKAFYFRITVELAFPFYLYLVLAEKKFRPNMKNPINLAILAFLIINIFSAILGVNVLKSFMGNFERMGGVYYLAHLVALYFYLQLLGSINHRYVKWFLQALIGVAILLTLNGLSGWAGGPVLVQDPSLPLRVSSTFGNPIFFPSFLIIPMFLCAYFALQEENLGLKIMYWLFAALQLVGIYGSGTRGAVVGLVGGLAIAAVVYLFLTKNKYVKWYGGGAALILLVCAGLLFTFPQVLPQGSIVKRLFSLDDSNTKARLIQWKIALKGFGQRPLLGTGSENYYVVGNKYYDTAIYQYDRSWFDKPHNYLLEILVTNGVLGFLAYLATLVFGIWALVRGYKRDFFSLGEFCILLGALLVYEIQNLTVFDTVSASVAFFVLLGFYGYLWRETESRAVVSHKKTWQLPTGFSLTVFVLCAIIMGFAVYATNVQGISAAKNVNYGFAYSSVDLQKADQYFRNALYSRYNFDPTETTAKYLDFGTQLLQTSQGASKAEAEDIFQEALDAGEVLVKKVPNDPIAWQRLSNAYLVQAIQTQVPLNPRAEQAIQMAAELTPKRPEPPLVLARLKLYQNNTAGAETILKNLIASIPTNTDAKMQLALLYAFTNRPKEGVPLVEESLKQNYQIRQAGEILWVGDYYAAQKDYANAERIYLQAGKVEPTNEDLFWKLTQVYALAGQKEQATQLARAIAQVNPSRKAEMDAFVRSLK